MRPYCLAVPRFHVELDPPSCASIRYCTPWREANDGNLLLGLPFDRREAMACLNDWQNMSSDELRREAYHAAGGGGCPGGLYPGEEKDLEKFAGKNTDFNVSSCLERAQRFLLLAWMQEKRALELRELNKRCASGYKRLFALLDHVRQDSVEETDEDNGLFLPDWRFVLKYLWPFIPDDVIIYTRSSDIRGQLEYLGCQCPAEKFSDVLPEDALRLPGLGVFSASIASVLGDTACGSCSDHNFLWITA